MKQLLVLAAGLAGFAAAVQAQDRMPAPEPPAVLPVVAPPVVATPSAGEDEKPVAFESFAVEAEIRGFYARVETTMRLRNPNGRVLEGDLRFPLPDGAAVCGYALDVNGRMVDGVVVPKQEARAAFEAEVRKGVDPGLVEHVKGNIHETRVYPIPARGTRTVRLSYVAPVALSPEGDAAFLLALPRVPLEELKVKLETPIEGAAAPILGGLGDRRFEAAEAFWRVESTETNVVPGGDVWVALPKAGDGPRADVERGPDGAAYFAVSAMAPGKPGKKLGMPRHVLWDASGSRVAADLEKEYALLGKLPAKGPFRLTVFRDTPEETRTFATRAALLEAVKAAPLDGGTDFAALAAALERGEAAAAGGKKGKKSAKKERYLLFSDGYDTLTDRPLDFGGRDVTAVVSQTEADRAALRRACGGRVIDLQTRSAAEAAAEIASPPALVEGLEGEGVSLVEGIGVPATGRVRLLGRLDGEEARVRIRYAGGGKSAEMTLKAADAREGKVVAMAWAAARAAELGAAPQQNKTALLALGRRFGVVSPATSLLVLETLAQWLEHGIEPPETWPEMREQWQAAMKNRRNDEESAEARHLETLKRLWAERVSWWERGRPEAKPKQPAEPVDGHDAGESRVGRFMERLTGRANARRSASVPDGMPVPAAMAAGVEDEVVMREIAFEEAGSPMAAAMDEAAGGEDGEDGGGALQASIAVKAWSPDVPYLKRIQAAEGAARYAAYLEERKEWTTSPAFYLDCAEAFAKDDAALAVRILTNLAELRMEDPALLRVLAWRLQEMPGGLDRAIVLLRRVAELRPEEPQSFRDLAVALALRGQTGKKAADLAEAAELLRKVALTPWKRHADSIPLFALEELNALKAWSEAAFKKGKAPKFPDMPEELAKNLPVDIRIVLTWDADNTDVDLHVVEPSEEEAYYAHNRTASGGMVSRDVTDGYGPEEYLLRKGEPGEYRVLAHYFGSHQQTVMGPATVAATIFTHWGMPTQARKTMTLRLDRPKEKVPVGSITFQE